MPPYLRLRKNLYPGQPQIRNIRRFFHFNIYINKFLVVVKEYCLIEKL